MNRAIVSALRASLVGTLATTLVAAIPTPTEAGILYTDRLAGQEEFLLIDDAGNLIEDGYSQAIASDVKGGNFSPDMSVILFWSAMSGGEVLYLMDPETFQYMPLPHDPYLEWGPRGHSWIDTEYASFTGSRSLWWVNTVTGQYGILLSQADCQAQTGKREPCRMDVFGGACAFHAYNGYDDQVYLAEIVQNPSAAGYSIPPQSIRHVASPFAMNRDALFSPDGRYLGWTAASGNYTYGVAIVDLAAAGTAHGPVGPVGASLQDWFPDNTMLVRVPSYAGVNSPALLRVTLEGEATLVKYVAAYYDLSNTAQWVPVNRCPSAEARPAWQEVEVGIDPIVITGQVADADGGELAYTWSKGPTVLASGSVTVAAGGEPTEVPELTIEAGDPRFPVLAEDHQILLEATDGMCAVASEPAGVHVVDTTPPYIELESTTETLWPPTHKLVPVTIRADVDDNSAGAVTIRVTVQSTDPADAAGDGRTIPDWYIDSIDQQTGIVELRLRSERAGTGDARTYTITVTATDGSGNASTATISILAPHDQRRK